MGRVEQSVTLNVPVEDCYRIWTDFEDYPRFMHHLKSVTRYNHSNLYHWSCQIGHTPRVEEFDVEVDLMEPDRVVSWRTVGDTPLAHAVVILLHDMGDGTSRVEMIMTFPGNTLGEFVDDMWSTPQRIVDTALTAFVNLAERRTPYHQASME